MLANVLLSIVSICAYVLYAYLCTTDNMLKFTAMLELVLSCMVLILIVFFRIRDKRKRK